VSEEFDKLTDAAMAGQEQGFGLLEKLFTVAQPGAVFGEPVSAEGRTVITASEVTVGLGVGFGFGGGSSSAEAERTEEGEAEGGEDAGMGGGGGGGGGASGRPVAIISLSADGVEIEPVVDVTKIALAFFTAFGSMFFMLARMRKAVMLAETRKAASR
jgi:uncharacterized spore protein YtfJ